VQALGQCLFLPMLVIGGVAVPIASLPDWAQRLASFFPGRYAVEAMQAATTGNDLSALPLPLAVLAVTGFAAVLAAMKLFRWEHGRSFATLRGKGWLALILAVWVVTGLLAGLRERSAAALAAATAPPVVVADPLSPWKQLTAKDVAGLSFKVPSDYGVVAPFAPEDELPDEALQAQMQQLRDRLPQWEPGRLKVDDLQRVRNLLCVAAVADAAQEPAERYIPGVVLAHLQTIFPKPQLIQMLAWIALHPDDGAVVQDVSALGLTHEVGGPDLVRDRMYFYALKCIIRLTGRLAADPVSPAAAPP